MMKRIGAAAGVAGLLTMTLCASPVWAVEPPKVDPAALPPDGPPEPREEMELKTACRQAVTIAQPDVTQPAPATAMLNLPEAWKFSTGAGVTVAVIDTGVTPSPRFKDLVGGGDYVMGKYGDGLEDCQVHGTIVASLIAAQPQGTPVPPRRPENVPAQPPIDGVSAIPSPPPTTAAPPSPTTVTVTVPPPAPPAPPPPPEGDDAVAPAAGDGDTVTGTDPASGDDTRVVAPPPPGAPDGLVGVAPDARLVSVRQSSQTHGPKSYNANDKDHKAGDAGTLALAVRHVADLPGMEHGVINISVVNCINAATPIDQAALGAALRYAAVEKDIVVVAAAGNTSGDCPANPLYDPLHPDDPRNWAGAQTVVAPAWWQPYVLAVGAVEPNGEPATFSVPGPWVQIAAPGNQIMGIGPEGTVVNANPNVEPSKPPVRIYGSSFAAPIVSGTAALVRAAMPNLSAPQVIHRLVASAHPPAGGVDNRVGYGIVDPVAALTKSIPDGPVQFDEHLADKLIAPPPPAGRDMRPGKVAALAAIAVIAAASVLILVARRRG
ncbi:S8 family serine peptidase [Mycolicibacterium farcinogenes]|nr:S8 family serine peptidase [Mycolicibacterium farcinogenes]